MKVDVFVTKDRQFDREALARALPESLDEKGEKDVFPVARAEDVVVAKLEWYRLGGEVSERQWADVKGVLRISAEVIDPVYLRRMAALVGVGDLLEAALSEAC